MYGMSIMAAGFCDIAAMYMLCPAERAERKYGKTQTRRTKASKHEVSTNKKKVSAATFDALRMENWPGWAPNRIAL